MGTTVVLKVGCKLCLLVATSVLAEMVYMGIVNKTRGKTFFGEKKKPKKKTYVDWKGNVVLGTKDYEICG